MRTVTAICLAALLLSAGTRSARCENPCSGVDRALPKERAKELGPAVAKQLGPRAEVTQSFQLGGWSILYVSRTEADDAYVFYSGDPMRSSFITLWGGVALADEEDGVRDWTLKNAPGIPPTLANCFAWHVTKER